MKTMRQTIEFDQHLKQLIDSVMQDEASILHANATLREKCGMKKLYAASKRLKQLPGDYSKRRYATQKRNGRPLRTVFVTGARTGSGVSTVIRRTANALKSVHGTSRIIVTDETLRGSIAVHKGLYLAKDMANVAVFDDVPPEAFSVKLFTDMLHPDVPYAYKNPSNNTRFFTPEYALLGSHASVGDWLVKLAYANYNRVTFRDKTEPGTLHEHAKTALIALAQNIPTTVTVDVAHEHGRCLVVRSFSLEKALWHTGTITKRDVDTWYIDRYRFPYPDKDALTQEETHEALGRLVAFIRQD